MSAPSPDCSRLWEIIINCWTENQGAVERVKAANDGLYKAINESQPGVLDQKWFEDTEDSLEKAGVLLEQAYKLIHDRQLDVINRSPLTKP